MIKATPGAVVVLAVGGSGVVDGSYDPGAPVGKAGRDVTYLPVQGGRAAGAPEFVSELL